MTLGKVDIVVKYVECVSQTVVITANTILLVSKPIPGQLMNNILNNSRQKEAKKNLIITWRLN